MHFLVSSRPNVVPIAVAIPMGPFGRRTIHFQPVATPQMPSNHNIDPTLLSPEERAQLECTPSVDDTPPSAITSTPAPASSAPAPGSASRPPKASVSLGADKLAELKTRVQSIPQKRPLEDRLLDMQKYVLILLVFFLD